MELMYKISKPLLGEDRVYRYKEKIALFLETDGKCAKCGMQYNCLDKGNSINTNKSNLEIAHIYGLRNFRSIQHDGKMFHIRSTDKLNSYENLILLCNKCHKNYDKIPNYNDYVEMVEIKKNLARKLSNETNVYIQLYFCLDEIIEVCNEIETIGNFNYDLTLFIDKLKLNKIDIYNQEHYKNYLTKYATYIDNFFRDCADDTGIKLVTCFSNVYNELKKTETDKNAILELISRSKILNELQKKMSIRLFDALLSYMIWKCEVLEKYDLTQ